MKKLIVSLLVTAAILGAYCITGHAADYTMIVSVEDITEVSEQITEMDEELDILAKLVWGEARGVESQMEQAAVVWCALNRVDAGYDDGTIRGVVTQRSQFAYTSSAPVTDDLRALAQDVVTRWLLEKQGVEDVGRVLPCEYVYFAGHDGHNWFRIEYRCRERWDWDCTNPYESEV